MELTDFLRLNWRGKAVRVKDWVGIGGLEDKNLQEDIFKKLESDGILTTTSTRGSYFLIDGERVLRPSSSSKSYNFKTEQAITDYLNQVYGDRQNSIGQAIQI